MNLKYKFGYFVGIFTSIFICLYALYDGYENLRNHQSVAADIALLFAFFAWKRIFLTNSILYEIYINEVKKSLEDTEEL